MRHPFSLLFLLLLFACMQLLVLPGWASDVPPAGDTTPLQSPIVPEPAPAAVADPVAPKRKEDEIPPTVGRIVLYVLPEGMRGAGEIRPAIIVRVFPECDGITLINLQVFQDGGNDDIARDYDSPVDVTWRTSVHHDQDGKQPGTWHWMPYQIGQSKQLPVAPIVAELGILAAELSALRAEYDATKGHVQRIGECPGLKLF